MNDARDIAAALDILERASEAATSWHEVATDLHRHASSAGDPMHVLASAFDYMLDVRSQNKQPGFEPMIRFESGECVPPELAEVEEGWLEVWRTAADASSPPVARARLHDLLAERRVPDVVSHATAAVTAYREIANNTEWHSVDRADGLVRALGIARRFKLDSAEDILAEMVSAAEASVDADDPEPGVALALLSALVSDRDCPEDVDRLLDVARTKYQEAYLVEDVINLQRRRGAGDVDRMAQLDRERVEAWIWEADRASGLVRVVHLETAARLARAAGLRDLEEISQQRLQAAPKDEFELQHVSAEASIPPEVVDEYLRPFTDAEDVPSLLVALISHPPATGDVAENHRALQKSKIEFPLQFIFPRVVLGGDGLPRWSPTTDAEKEDGELARQELLRFQILGDLMARGLWLGGTDRRRERSDVETFVDTLPNEVPKLASRLADALENYWQQNWTAACIIALPCVEALCRTLVLKVERGVYETQRGHRPGQYPGLGALLRWMRDAGLDGSWYRYLWTTLASPAGLNLRNEVAHGLALEVGPSHAAAVIHMALYLAALDVETTSESATSPTA